METSDEPRGETSDHFEPKLRAFATAHRLSERELEISRLRPSTWAGSCTGFTSPDSNGLGIWADGGICYITIL